jgi:DNA-binding NtrC family response regulator
MIVTSCVVIQSEGSNFGERLKRILSPTNGFSFDLVSWASLATETLIRRRADVVVALAVPDVTPALRLFERLESLGIVSPILAVLPESTADSIIKSVVRAATDFVVLPARDEELRQRVARLAPPAESRHTAVRDRLTVEAGLRHLVGADPAFTHVIAQLPRMAGSDMPVLIVGETGTGKELCARALHHLSRRRDRSFVAVDCGSIPDHLFENELFGHVRGAFTDAHRDQRGLVGMAQGGTLFLDEIDGLSAAAQGKVLRLLQERVYRPLGADRFMQADVNVIAATNRNLAACVREQRFRPDLYYRLNVLTLALPPLRKRRRDILTLACHFLEEARLSSGAGSVAFSTAAQSILLQHDWPGNVRELQNVIRRAVLACHSTQISPNDLLISDAPEPTATASDRFRTARTAVLEAFERRYVEELLQRHNGNVTHAAREAEKDRRAFGRLIKKYGIRKHSRSER